MRRGGMVWDVCAAVYSVTVLGLHGSSWKLYKKLPTLLREASLGQDNTVLGKAKS